MYLMHGKDDVLSKAQVPIWDVPIGREPIKMEGPELEGEDETRASPCTEMCIGTRARGDVSAGREQRSRWRARSWKVRLGRGCTSPPCGCSEREVGGFGEAGGFF